MDESTEHPDTYFYDLELFPNCFMASFQKRGSDEIKTVTLHPSKSTDQLGRLLSLFQSGGYFVGYNSRHFDDPIMNWLLMHNAASMDRKTVIRKTYELAGQIIDGSIPNKYKYADYFKSIDLMMVGNLYTKSLKRVAINLKWPKLQDFPYDIEHQVQEDEIPELRDYNHNDVGITAALFEELKDDINLRVFISRNEGVDVISRPNSTIADMLLEKKYSQEAGVPKRAFKNSQTTYDGKIDISDVIVDDVNFQTSKMQSVLWDLKNESIYPGGNFKKEFWLGRQKYTLAKGGLHSNHDGEWIEPGPNERLLEADVSSYYPFLIFQHGFCPDHLSSAFIDILEEITMDRIQDKREGNWTASAAKKIVINSVYGKSRDDNSWMHDPMVTYQTTINGQLFLLMLIERLEEAGMPVVYANTDGINVKVPGPKVDEYHAICDAWEQHTGFVLDHEEFQFMALADVNNYIWQKDDGSLKRKGRLNKNRHKGSWGLGRSFDMPVVPLAVERYFTDGVDPAKTIREHEDVYDFCTTQNVDSSYDIEYHTIEDNQMHVKQCQSTNRWYVSKMGGALLKVRGDTQQSLEAGEHVRLLNGPPTPEDRKAVREEYYIQKARQEIEPIANRQLTLV
jgi:hypothetical protein